MARRPRFLAIDDESGLRIYRKDGVIDPRTGLFVHKRKGYDGWHPQERPLPMILDDPLPLPNARPDDPIPPIDEDWTPPND